MTSPFRIRGKYILACLCVVLAGALFLSACGRSKATTENNDSNASTAEAAELHPVEVTTSEATSEEVPAFIQATGSFDADETSDVAAQTSGQVAQTPIDVGAFVKKGAVIAVLDARDARLRFQQALAAERQNEAALRQAEAKIGLLEGGTFSASEVPEVRAASQNYESARAQAELAETNARRYENLVETGDVSRMIYDQAKTQAETARAQANAARQQLEVVINVAKQNNQAIAQAQANLDAARSATALARKTVDDTNIRAPFSGYVSDRPVAPGEYITPASKVVTLLRTDPIKLKLQLPEADAGRAHPGMTVVATVTAFPDREFTGKVTIINPSIDPVSRTVTVEAYFDNPGNALRPNMFASARILLPEGEQGIFIPKSAIITDSTTASSRVYVIDGTVARLRVVQTGPEMENRVQVLSGVTTGEKVATSNLDQLFDGAQVVPK